MKKITFIALALIFISCSKSGLEKEFNELSIDKDLIEVSIQISPQELELLETYIEESYYASLTNETYSNLLIYAEDKERQRIAEEKRIEEERITADNLKKITTDKTKLLCAKKWKIKEYATLIEIEDTEENIQLAKKIFKKAIVIKDSETITSVERKSNRTFVKGEFDEHMKKIYNDFGRRWKKYSSDGTYEEYYSGETTTGTWKFISANEIRERRPSESSHRKIKTDVFILEIQLLDENTFHLIEKQLDPFNPDNNISDEIIMKL